MIDDIRYHMDHIRFQARGFAFALVGVLLVGYISVSGAQKLNTVKPHWIVSPVQKEKAAKTPAPMSEEARMQMLAARLNEIEPQ